MNTSSENHLEELVGDVTIQSNFQRNTNLNDESQIIKELVEEHFQDSDFFVNNDRRPDFKLNEPCSSNSIASFNSSGILDSSQSFIVLSPTSFEAVQAQSLSNYELNKENTSLVDYNPVISNMSPLEIEEKLSEMLQENLKLKETIAKNNDAMKKQFNSLIAWQETVAEIQQNHKKKFAETRELINQLKLENIMLRRNQKEQDQTSNKLSRTVDETLEKSMEKSSNDNDEESEENCLLDLNSINPSDSLLKEDVEKSVNLSSLIKSVTFECSNDFIVMCPVIENTEIHETTVKYSEEENNSPKDMISSFEQKDFTRRENFAPVISTENPQVTETLSKSYNQFKQNLESHSEKMETLFNSFSLQTSRYFRIQESAKKSIDCLENLEIFLQNKSSVDNSMLTLCKNTLTECRKNIVDEQLENIAERQNWIRVHDQLQKIFSDYKSVLFELEIMQEENKKLSADHKNKVLQILEEAENSKENVKKRNEYIETERVKLENDKVTLDQEKKSLFKLRESIMETRRDLAIKLECLEQDRLNLNQEKAALDSQSKLYENQGDSLLMEKKNLKRECLELNEKIRVLEEQLQEQKNLSHSYKEDNVVMKAQLDIFRSDYELEKDLKEATIREKNRMAEQIQALTVQNERLEREIYDLKQKNLERELHSSSSQLSNSHQANQENIGDSVRIQPYMCPVCGRQFSILDSLVDHVDRCIDE